MSTAVEKKKAIKQNRRTRTHNFSTGGLYILAFLKLRGQPPEQSLRSSRETHIARLTTLLIPRYLATDGKIVRMIPWAGMITDQIEWNKAEAQRALSNKKIPITMAA